MKARSNNIIESIRHNKKILATIVTALALMVAIGTTYTLISPAATLETADEPESAAVLEAELTEQEQAEVDEVCFFL